MNVIKKCTWKGSRLKKKKSTSGSHYALRIFLIPIALNDTVDQKLMLK